MQGITSVNRYQMAPNFGSARNRPSFSGTGRDTDMVGMTTDAGSIGLFTVALDQLAKHLSKKLMQCKEFTTGENVQKVADAIVKDNKLDVTVKYLDESNKGAVKSRLPEGFHGAIDAVAAGQNAFYSNDVKLAVAPKSAKSLILHELGHAVNSAKGGIMELMQRSRKWALAVPVAMAVLNPLLKTNNPEEKSFIEKYAFGIGFLAFLPTIIEEAKASLTGIKYANNTLGKAISTGPLKKAYAFALGTYVIAGLGLGLATKERIMS